MKNKFSLLILSFMMLYGFKSNTLADDHFANCWENQCKTPEEGNKKCWENCCVSCLKTHCHDECYIYPALLIYPPIVKPDYPPPNGTSEKCVQCANEKCYRTLKNENKEKLACFHEEKE